ncbi:MAG: 3'-5' exonuclease, partial [Myxococcales bacterium]|nr:3'-5' exonuclease [Myxococcales bacterium]
MARKFGIQVHAIVVMRTRYHAIDSDPRGLFLVDPAAKTRAWVRSWDGGGEPARAGACAGLVGCLPWAMQSFVALDFETADRGRDSACAIGMVRVEGARVTAREHRLIRPPRSRFEFTHIHGITWEHVRGERSFSEVWQELLPMLEGVSFIAAHNASFDRGVLHACCERSSLAPPALAFECTVKLARARWALRPTTLPDVCRHLKIPLNHHDALSDAEACAQIVV